jgi:histidyl-tRNA synthetase
MDKVKISAIKGMNDILPAGAGTSEISSYQWEWLEGKVRSVMAQFAYPDSRIDTSVCTWPWRRDGYCRKRNVLI